MAQKRGDATRRRILDAAAREFAINGFEGGSMRAIARQCGIELALVQYHFNDKLNLWGSVLDDVIGSYQSKLDGIMRGVADRPPSEQLVRYLETLIHHAAADPVFVGIMSHARTDLSPGTDAFRERIRGRSRRTVKLIRAAQAEGAAVPGDPIVIFYMMVGAALRIFMLAADVPDLAGGTEGSGNRLNEHVRSCVAAFLPRLGATRSTTKALKKPAQPHAGATGTDRPPALYLLASLDSAIRRSMDHDLRSLEMTQAQMIALTAIANQPRLSSATLARLLYVSPQTVMMVVKALGEKGLIRRDSDWRKRRALPIEVTPAGRARLARLDELMTAAEARLLDTLSSEERLMLHGLLARLVKRHRPLSGLAAGTP